MHVNNEQTNTQRMLEHNQGKERVFSAGSLQRKLTDLVVLDSGKKFNLDFRESTILNCLDYSQDVLESLFNHPSDSSSPLISDADAQLLIKLKFLEKIDCSQLVFHKPAVTNDDEEGISNARLVRVYVNRSDIDFLDLDNGSENGGVGFAPAITFELPFEYSESPFIVNLQGSKFTRVSSIQIFIEDNFGTDRSRLGNISIRGFLTPNYHVEYK